MEAFFFFLIWKEANQAQRIQYKTKAEQNILTRPKQYENCQF